MHRPCKWKTIGEGCNWNVKLLGHLNGFYMRTVEVVLEANEKSLDGECIRLDVIVIAFARHMTLKI